MNKVQLVGRLTKDVDSRTTSSGINCAQFTVAVDRRFKDANGERQADFINCVAWRQTAQFISQYFSKGMKIGVCGSIQTRTYDDQNGKKVYVTEVIVDEAEFIESKAQPQAHAAPTRPVAPSIETVNDVPENLPFEI